MTPFSAFFYAILEHYRIHVLHLQPNSIVILIVFACLCEAYLGVRPSVALFRHFYILRLTTGGQYFWCVSFQIFEGVDGDILPMDISKRMGDGLRTHRVLMDPGQAHSNFFVPKSPAKKHSG